MAHRRKRLRVRAVAAIAAATTVAATLVSTTGASVASAAAPDGAVISGNARFEVLSPTLIRTEYAGDAAFVDAATFNAIGRDGFGQTPFTTQTSAGWLTLTTSAVTLKYKVGSGQFTDQNLTVTVNSGPQSVTATPWQPSPFLPACAFGSACEAENQLATGVTIASDHPGYTGSGFAAGFEGAGDSLSSAVNVPTAGTYQFAARYANSLGGDGQTTTRTLTVSVDGGAGQTLSLPTTADWNTWAVAGTALTLPAGRHTVTLARTGTDSGHVNVDSTAVVTTGSPYPGPASAPVMNCPFGTVCEAEAGQFGGTASLQKDHNGHSGTGFVAGLQDGASDTVRFADVPAAGSYALQLRVSNAQPVPGTVSVAVGSAPAATVSVPITSSWDSWRTITVPVSLSAGANNVTIGCPGPSSCKLNLDTVAVATTGSPLLSPHAALGGYRRALDNTNGAQLTTPGLMYQDGWSLLDDTASAIFDNVTKKVTPRPGHGGQPYQDGYVFGYGHTYAQGLADLAKLTGPSKLLPRWAYGVWYSEYYDRTAADYQNTIIPRFRSDGVPLDVLVTDTDFKSPDRWNGWEIDTAKFPDPAGFFAWSQSQGLHNTLNIHPSILPVDPQYAQAQATAKNKLTPNNTLCFRDPAHGDCYTFDFGDPDQLKAYLDLHQPMEQQGADFWWLDWCCEQSYSTLAGVSPDAWINEQYANDTAKNVGRGFAFSRAYSSLQKDGYLGPVGQPTGPWADKRTTVHFTGDTTSTWETVKAEVGYTPAESVATGLSAVSHDIGGFNNDGTQAPGAEPGSTKLADDLYARWVQLGTFQPIDRLHGNHSDRLPWQYGAAAKTSAEKFLNLRENLVPYTYSLARNAAVTGLPVVIPAYVQYPEEQEAYATFSGEYLYGPNVLVAPVTTPGTTATTRVWFPPGSQWTDYFTGTTYAGGTIQNVTTDLNAMPVFIKSGGIMPTRTDNVTNDVQNPLSKVTFTVPVGAAGSYSLYEDDGTTTSTQNATTAVQFSQSGSTRTLTISPAVGSFPGQVTQRQWQAVFLNATAPTSVKIDGATAPSSAWSWNSARRSLTVTVPTRSVTGQTTVSYQ